MAVLILMAEQTKKNNATSLTNTGTCTNTTATTSQQSPQQQQGKPVLYDFLSMKPADSSSVVLAPKSAALTEASLSAASALLGASSGGGGGGSGSRGLISSSSDLASVERQVGNHLEGIPFYGTRNDLSGTEISNRLAASKRSNPESAFMNHDYLENLHLTKKMMRTGSGRERQRRSSDDEVFHPMRPTSGTLVLHPPSGNRTDAKYRDPPRDNVSRWERAIPMSTGASVQYPPRGAQFVPFMQHISHKYKEANVSPPIISQSAADEGSRTGIKGPEVLSSVNATGGVTEKNHPSAAVPTGSRLKSGAFVAEPESCTPSSQQGLVSASRQMTIFYGGQAHVFDDVHPNKADVIMALAGSNGGSWSTTYSVKSTAKAGGIESCLPCGDLEGRPSGNLTLPQEFRGRLPVAGITSHATGSNDRTPIPSGYHGGIVMGKHARNPVQGVETAAAEERREI